MKATIIILITIVINILVIIVTRFGVIMIQRGFVNVAARYESTISTNAIIHFTWGLSFCNVSVLEVGFTRNPRIFLHINKRFKK